MSRSPLDLDERLRREREMIVASSSTERMRRLRERRATPKTCSSCGDPLPLHCQKLCHFCRLPVAKIRVTDCVVCGRKFVAHGQGWQVAVTCSVACRMEMKAAKVRHKSRIRDGVRKVQTSNVTAAQEAEMRRRARKCPMPGCGVWMTGKPHLPNSKELDHILPLNQGGTHTHGNVRIICRRCNQTRPKNGSDYLGTLALWAEDPAAVARQRQVVNRRTCRKGLHPWISDNIVLHYGRKRCAACLAARGEPVRRRSLQQCKCGALFSAPGNQFMCKDCIDVAAHRAAELHASGLSWSRVATEVGYGTDEGARYAAKRIGYTPC